MNIREFSNLIDTFAREAFQELEFPLDKPGVNTEKNQLLKDIRKMKDIKHRIDLFDVGQLGGRASTAERKELTYEGASQLSDEAFYEKYGEHRVGSKENPLGGPQVAPQRAAQPAPAPQPAPQPTPIAPRPAPVNPRLPNDEIPSIDPGGHDHHTYHPGNDGQPKDLLDCPIIAVQF